MNNYEIMGITVMTSYFWILKVVGISAIVLMLFDIIKSKKVSRTKYVVYSILIILILVAGQSVRLVPTTQEVNAKINTIIEKQKVLPDKISDSSFEEAQKNLKGISKEELK